MFQTSKIFSFLEPKDILDENWEACGYPIDCQVNATVKAQKSMKDNRNRIVISSSLWTLWSNDHMQFASSWYSPKWRSGEVNET